MSPISLRMSREGAGSRQQEMLNWKSIHRHDVALIVVGTIPGRGDEFVVPTNVESVDFTRYTCVEVKGTASLNQAVNNVHRSELYDWRGRFIHHLNFEVPFNIPASGGIINITHRMFDCTRYALKDPQRLKDHDSDPTVYRYGL